jgi:hypothetical protein
VKISPATVLKIYAPAVCFIGLTILAASSVGIPIYELVADPGEITKQPSHLGFLSQVGNLLWCATAAICLFSAYIVRVEPIVRSKRLFLFLLVSGLFSGQLLLDDLFRLHEKAGKILFGSEVPISTAAQNFAEMLVFVIYILFTVAFLSSFRKVILRSNYLFLLLAICFFGLSILVDMTPDTMPGHHLIEESAKLLGIFSWFIYFVRFCLQNLRLAYLPSKPTNESDAYKT